MQAVLYVCHGSRVKEANEQARFFTEQAMKLVDAPIQEVCYLELAAPSIAQGFATCVTKGATRIAVVPVLLLTAVHAKEDIPNELLHVKEQYPNVTVTYGRPFGVHSSIIDILLERIDVNQAGEGARVLLVGRGSSDADVKRDMKQIAQLLKEAHPFQSVEICFLAAAEPRFEEALRTAATMQTQLFVVPYLLFTGLLMKGMEREVRRYGNHVVLCSYLGYHAHLQRILAERVSEAIRGEAFVSDYSAYGR
ncbi:sirohydrochlorin chelatase [Ectobacillus antri]|jgi:sirohydrochlorin ferrochelatase|uniref:Sirohydrochlorin chelatase n=1 Tax=Ectobacillus antri TaxID=2486280 RepID=A0ABT6H4E3_9BACI|nr:sirohydrochlorin chelatase [Ectobacillus antri]MDG4656859.1 sirohydrochlorin chelatase [Ectobacillus antri]MDG5754244.1 sirohydrochlorin chelatase [Ectobacillus antri]